MCVVAGGALANAAAPPIVRVRSMAIGFQDAGGSLDLGGTSLLSPPDPGKAAAAQPGHKRQRSAAQLPNIGGPAVWKDIPKLRELQRGVFDEHHGLALTSKMCVMRATLVEIYHFGMDLGAVLLEHIIAKSVRPSMLGPSASPTAGNRNFARNITVDRHTGGKHKLPGFDNFNNDSNNAGPFASPRENEEDVVPM